MEAYDSKVMRKLIRQSPEVARLYQQIESELKTERIANPPGPGNLRKLKKKAEADARERVHQIVGSDESHARQARLYDFIHAKEYETATRS